MLNIKEETYIKVTKAIVEIADQLSELEEIRTNLWEDMTKEQRIKIIKMWDDKNAKEKI